MIERDQRDAFADQMQERRRRGRPRRAVPMITTGVRIPEDVYDVLCRIAMEQREPLDVVVRNVLSSFAATSRS